MFNCTFTCHWGTRHKLLVHVVLWLETLFIVSYPQRRPLDHWLKGLIQEGRLTKYSLLWEVAGYLMETGNPSYR